MSDKESFNPQEFEAVYIRSSFARLLSLQYETVQDLFRVIYKENDRLTELESQVFEQVNLDRLIRRHQHIQLLNPALSHDDTRAVYKSLVTMGYQLGETSPVIHNILTAVFFNLSTHNIIHERIDSIGMLTTSSHYFDVVAEGINAKDRLLHPGPPINQLGESVNPFDAFISNHLSDFLNNL